MRKVRNRSALAVMMVLSGGVGMAEGSMLLNLSAHIARGTCDVRISDSNPVSWRELSRDAFPLNGGMYRGVGFAPVRVVFGFCTPDMADEPGSIRLYAESVGPQDVRMAARELWSAGDAGVGFDVLVRRGGSQSGVAHRLTPRDNMLSLNPLHRPGLKAQDIPVPEIDVESRLRSYVKREGITPGVVKSILLLSVVYG